MSKVKEGYIYPAKKGNEHHQKYRYYLCEMTGDFSIVDCLPCDQHGNAQPGYEVGIPTYTSAFYVSRGVKFEIN